MSHVRCPCCRTVAEATFRFCYVCGTEFATGGRLNAAAPPLAAQQARTDSRSSSVAISVLGALGAVGALHVVLVLQIPMVQKLLLLALVGGFAAFGFTAAFKRGSEHAALGRAVLRGFAALAWVFLIGFVVIVGIVIYLFILCAQHVGKF
ncbi:MAG: hypothetical protein FD180_1488 [Planctomycetota bacterium]|nr:MAG: hypothetical protein FD180_1488 [Planctomycetota bacterium]